MKQRYLLLAIIILVYLPVLALGVRPLPSAKAGQDAGDPVLITAVYYDGFALFDADEAIALMNLTEESIPIGGWRLTDGGSTSVDLPQGTVLEPGTPFWITGDGTAFAQQFGRLPQLVLDRWPGYANSGDEVMLFDQDEGLIDSVVYGDGEPSTPGWQGAALQPYTVRGVFGAEGQVLTRKRDQSSGLPIADSDTAADWAQESSQPASGRRVQYPGWDSEEFFFPVREQRPAAITVGIAPDNAYSMIAQAVDSAAGSIRISTLTLENLAIGGALAKAVERGVNVRVLLEGAPVGGIDAHQKAICQRLELAGGQCWYMINNDQERIYDRYRYMHAKYIIIDEEYALVSSENLSPNSMPYDDKSDGTLGRRGVLLGTAAPAVVDGLLSIFSRDFDPLRHQDLLRWQPDHPVYGPPPQGYVPVQDSGGADYPIRYPVAVRFDDARFIELQQAPDNLLRSADGILGLIGRAGEGDTLLVQQLQERPYWGASTSNPVDDPNLRIEALIGAARRGAKVRLLLDSFFDDPDSPVSNAATCRRLQEIARKEAVSLYCRTANPTGLGIHNKMILAQVDGEGYVHSGSWNGTELASKGNREVTLLVQSNDAYQYLSEMFARDWPNEVHLPILAAGFRGGSDHILISELLYDPSGADETEFVEIANPLPAAVDISGFGLGDAVSRDDFEDLRRFPPGTILERGEALLVATSAIDFFDAFKIWPDFEILDSSPIIANLIDDPDWGDTAAFFRLGNQGDEVILRDSSDTIIDVVTYGSGSFPGNIPCPLLQGADHSLERYPYWSDSDSCPIDFRDWPFPSPGVLP